MKKFELYKCHTGHVGIRQIDMIKEDGFGFHVTVQLEIPADDLLEIARQIPNFVKGCK